MGKNDDTMDAAQAFEELQMEVALQRQAIEALGETVARHPAPDLSTDIAMLLKSQKQVLERLKRQEEALNNHPALQRTPAQFEEAFVQAGSKVMGDAAQQLKQATQEVGHERAQLRRLIGTAATQDQQNRWLWCTAGAALAVGLVLSPMIVSLLPVSLSSHIAAFLVGTGRWEAGWILMHEANPPGLTGLAQANALVTSNAVALKACWAAADKTRHEQRCQVTVLPP